jgi:hypothetical protein
MERFFGVEEIIMRRLFCDKCPDVEMQFKAPAIALAPGLPQRLTYACPKCKATIISAEQYPAQKLKLVEITPMTTEPADAATTSEQVAKTYEQQGGE